MCERHKFGALFFDGAMQRNSETKSESPNRHNKDDNNEDNEEKDSIEKQIDRSPTKSRVHFNEEEEDKEEQEDDEDEDDDAFTKELERAMMGYGSDDEVDEEEEGPNCDWMQV